MIMMWTVDGWICVRFSVSVAPAADVVRKFWWPPFIWTNPSDAVDVSRGAVLGSANGACGLVTRRSIVSLPHQPHTYLTFAPEERFGTF